MRLLLMLTVVLLTLVIIRAVPILVDDEANDEVNDETNDETDFDPIQENPNGENSIGMTRNADLEVIRQKLKKLKIANAQRAGKDFLHAPLQMIPRRSKVNIMRPAFPSIETINEGMEDYLYQGDIFLTMEQIDTLLNRNTINHEEGDDGEDDESSSSEATSNDRQRFQYRRKKRKVESGRNLMWSTTEPISYYISADFTDAKKEIIASALNFWQQHTCLTFKKAEKLKQKKAETEERNTDIIHFINGDGCYSYIGRVGGIQKLSFGDGCENVGFGILTHEIGHALGFWHEQARFDRDSFVKIDLKNVQEGRKGNFDKNTKNSLKTYNIPYEYGSIMHYESDSFAINISGSVIIATNQLFQQTMGQRTAPSFFDVYQANSHYNCFDKCNAVTISCRNGGYPNPSSCSKCICPSGFGGDFCNDIQTTHGESCGQQLIAAESWQLLEALVGENLELEPTDDLPAVWKPVICSWHIMAPVGKTVEVRVTDNSAQCYSGCAVNALQIKTSTNYKITGMRMCCKNDNENYTYHSESNLMPIIAEAYYRFSFKLQYRIWKLSTEAPEIYQEEECEAVGGMCQSSMESCKGTSQPTSPSQEGAACCIPPYQEERCREAQGQCKHKSDCKRGLSISTFCPSQPDDVVCCLHYG